MAITGNSRRVESNQTDVHEKLELLTEKYRTTAYARPISDHTQSAFDAVYPWLTDPTDSVPLILDACCGVGESTVKLAERFPQAKVLGVDKSDNRLEKHHAYSSDVTNYKIIRADLNDFWRLLDGANIRFSHQFIFYPNPYPKASQIQKRWYASAITPYLMKMSDYLEVRSNWRLYLEEFEQVAKVYGFAGDVIALDKGKEPLTPFERKYSLSDQTCFQLVLEKKHD